VDPQRTPLVCPTCGATTQSGPECRRCRSDLRVLQRLEAQRAAELPVLARALHECRWADALQSAHYIHTLRQDTMSYRLLAVCQLLNQQFAAAWETHRQFHPV